MLHNVWFGGSGGYDIQFAEEGLADRLSEGRTTIDMIRWGRILIVWKLCTKRTTSKSMYICSGGINGKKYKNMRVFCACE